MPQKVFKTDLLDQAKDILSAWVQIGDQLTFGSFTTATLVTALNQAEGFENEIRSLEAKLTDLRNKRDANRDQIWNIVKQVRLGVRYIFGGDSSEYEMVGGTRLSERKSPRRVVTLPAEPAVE